MAGRVSAAEPEELFRYARLATAIDDELLAEARRLGEQLGRFEDQCTESAFHVPVAFLSGVLSSLCPQWDEVDGWVGKVGQAFLEAGRFWGAGANYAGGPLVPARRPSFLESIAAFVGLSKLSLPSWLESGIGAALSPAGQNAIARSPRVVITLPPNPDTVGMAERVPGSGSDGHYYRFGNEAHTVKSDCTWYAAQAVYVASNGKIDLNTLVSPKEDQALAKNDPATLEKINREGRMTTTLGWAIAWAKGAEQYAKDNPDGPIQGVDGRPHAGDVVAFSYGHVAFVERAELVTIETTDKQTGAKTSVQVWRITISEENAYGSAIGDGKQVKVPGDPVAGEPTVGRWRRTIDVPVVSDTDLSTSDHGIRFIHFNYPPTQCALELDLGPSQDAGRSAEMQSHV